MNFLGGLLGSTSSPHDQVIANDLKRLNSVKVGLGDQAIAYVRSGAGETVLSSLSTLCKANELEVCKPWIDQTSPTLQRRELFARAHPYDLALMKRYTEALCAASTAQSTAKSANRYASEEPAGSISAPRSVRVFFSEAFRGLLQHHNSWPRKAVNLEGKGLTLETALKMVRALGGEAVDFFDVVYVKEGPYASSGDIYRQAVAILPAVEANPEAVIAAAQRMPAAARTDLIRDIAEWGVAKSGAFTEFLVTQAGDGSKAVREASISALAPAPSDAVTIASLALLKGGDAEQRAGMVSLLARLGSPSGLEALRAHRDTEKTARVATAIDTALSLGERRHDARSGTDDASGYIALDGRRIDVPPLNPVADGTRPTFGEPDRALLNAAIVKQNDQTRKFHEEQQRRGAKYPAHYLPENLASRAVDYFNSDDPAPHASNDLAAFLGWGVGANWAKAALAKLPDSRALLMARSLRGTRLHGILHGPGSDRVLDYLDKGGDLRALEAIDIAGNASFQHGDWQNRRVRQMERGDLLRSAVQDGYSFEQTTFSTLPRDAVWPYLAENLDVFDEALGLKPQGAIRLDRAAAIRTLSLLPATPARYFAPLLETATSETKAGRAEARAMLSAAPEVEERLVALLDDSRQAVRAGAAEWLSVRRDASAVAALQKRLKKEKSEVARAAILTALKRLGEDLSDLLGPKALIAEAEKGLKSAKFDKLDWMPLANLARMRFRDGATAPNDMLRWWVLSAFKLKQPGGNALFQIYLDQLDPRDAEAFSTWILESWIAYDTTRPNEAEANSYAKAHAPGRAQAYQRWNKDYTEELAFASLKQEYLSQYPNSGAESKGVLALAARAPSALAAERSRAYLKNHGSRTSQSSALLEMLAGMGDPVALQVVIAAATRLKQKGVQKFAGELIAKVAEARDWTLDELADRTVPTAGFDEDGILALSCGEDGKIYEARLDAALNVVLRNPTGKEVAGLPAGQDEATSVSKKQLATTKKELKQIVSMQSARLYEALCAERSWGADDWLRNFHDHPVMRRLIERVVWLGHDESGAIAGTFRPTAEGDFTDINDAVVDVAKFASVAIAHGALLDDATIKAWEQHLADYEVKPLFVQFGRALLRTTPEDGLKTMIEDRKGWLTDAFTIRGAATKLGYERGPALDGGFFNEYRKTFQSAGLAAVIEFTGNGLPEQNVPAALMMLRFEKAAGPGRFSGAVKLADVPPVLLSECWNDYHAMAAKAKYDAEWEKKSPW